MRKIHKILIGSIILAAAIIIAWLSYYQSTRFNSHITINHTKVGGLTADEAIKKLTSSQLKNEVYVGKKQIFNGKDTNMGFAKKDLPAVEKLLKKQHTLLPSGKAKNYSLVPEKADQYRSKTMKKQIEAALKLMNKSLKAPQDAAAQLENGKVIISKSVNGKQYDVPRILKAYQKQEYNSVIRFDPVYIQPLKADSPTVKKEVKLLKKLVQRDIDYKVQSKVYSLKGSDLIKKASVAKDMQVTIDGAEIKNKISSINSSQSTLNKDFQFKTHSGSVITVQGKSYGWAINVDKEAARIKDAFIKGEKTLSADNITGVGWTTRGTGYQNTTNNGIGDTYAEVSISEQHIWIYKDGKLAVETNVVTGRHDTNEDTNKGLWYIEYKRSPSTLTGSEVGNPNYSVKVQYWAPFTMGGQGFHDASWRKNWASDAYLTHGSGGCVNTPPSIMKTVYDNLAQYEPVIVY